MRKLQLTKVINRKLNRFTRAERDRSLAREAFGLPASRLLAGNLARNHFASREPSSMEAFLGALFCGDDARDDLAVLQ